MSSNQIFRRDAVEYIRTKWLGKALLTSGYSTTFIAALCAIFLVLLITLIIYGTYTRRINVNGEVISQPHPINIFSPQQGFITKKWVEVGDIVRKGQHLYQIDVSRTTFSGNVSLNSLEAINNQLSQIDSIINNTQKNKELTLLNLRQQLAQYQKAHKKSQELVDNAGKGMDDMRRTMASYGTYQRQGLITKDQLTNQRSLFYQQQNAFQSLNTQLIQESLQIAKLESEISTRASDFDNDISQYLFQKGDLKRQLAEVDASGMLLINSPSDGKIENMSVTQGQMVNVNDSLVQLTPSDNPYYCLVLWVPNNSVPYINTGDKVNIRYDAFPFEKFGQFPGRIISISNVPVSQQEIASYNIAPRLPNGGLIEPYYKVIVALDDIHFRYQSKPLMLSNGLKANVTLFLEKRPLYQWMLSPFYDIKKSVTGPVNE
ncbi:MULTISPECIES: HlyD family secretion protein [Yersinia pseudotuberculosis complex]|nr:MULTISPECIES: HlyD family secretion protein [Yersinia pseudotuberculosis complex]EDR34425.1 auxiliary transport protein, membrane fusion protein (MFP) family [Yersinia pestis biovar Orientalis str. IP275]EFA47979.1 auxiliary transport protein, membrane fusion protein (MFP) family protein [Yersinia pestis KIM D27]ERP73877.1 colicin V secretion protein CvaA [Yersinia pestis S3]CQD56890.1 putative secretion permease [Yersinia intermedia]ABG15408.1 hypothetical protein YPA_3446 [Yersinia pestis